MRLADREEIWLIRMEHPDDSKVHTLVSAPVPNG
jgi:hypothetical protein